MARKPVGLPPGVELRNGAIRIRFTWNGERCSETLSYPASKEGIASASRLRDQVVSLNKLGLLSNEKYAELFPTSAKADEVLGNTFGEYAQIWLDSRVIVEGTKKNYRLALNNWWMPKLAVTPLASITTPLMRKLLAELPWTTSQVKSSCMSKIRTIFNSAVNDGLLSKNPMNGLELPKKPNKNINPFTQEEADKVIEYLYNNDEWQMQIYGAYFEFAFYSGMRLSEITALKWSEIDYKKKAAFVCRIIAERVVEERTKTNTTRYVLLNSRALHALEFAKQYQERRKEHNTSIKEFPFCFPPAQGGTYIRCTGALGKGWKEMLIELKIKHKPPYNTRHTYATICLMSGMTPAFIAHQLGHSVEMLLSTYTKWMSNENDWEQMAMLNITPKLPQSKN